MNSPSNLAELFQSLQRGELDAAAAAQFVEWRGGLPAAATASADVDLDRERRCGFPEVVYCPGKTIAAIEEILRIQLGHGQNCLATRVTAEQAHLLLEMFPDARYNPTALTLSILRNPARAAVGLVAIITAGTGDLPVAEEALETARWMGCGVELIVDVGVAGPQRLLANLSRFTDADAIVVVAGMEGALPSVVGGHVACPVIAVPTSIGYGASFQGLAALLGMLNSCAANVTVVNIDAGFKGGYVAGLITRRRHA